MVKILTEEEVTLVSLNVHLQDSGFMTTIQYDVRILLHTSKGIGYYLTMVEGKKFIRIGTYLPLDKIRPEAERNDFERRLNSEIFLPVFRLDADGELDVSYVMTFQHGLIAGQFVSIIHRFSSLLDYIVTEHNSNNIIRFDQIDAEADGQESTIDFNERPNGMLLN
ncbi:hypothetical protein [Noviherbaspirillum malthae]|uniref:hypothetical protein n=1 Tax=Noviherbaspirillum malthae TaxID=1260987 RepID=UPI00188DCED0|nr:hypothetical protein [Noviherbaspirillum malthae]